METLLAIVAYRCEIAGKPTESIDIQVRYFASQTEAQIVEFLRSEPVHSYPNDQSALVSWPLVGLLALEAFEPSTNGKEVVGYIAECQEFVKWAHNIT